MFKRYIRFKDRIDISNEEIVVLKIEQQAQIKHHPAGQSKRLCCTDQPFFIAMSFGNLIKYKAEKIVTRYTSDYQQKIINIEIPIEP